MIKAKADVNQQEELGMQAYDDLSRGNIMALGTTEERKSVS